MSYINGVKILDNKEIYKDVSEIIHNSAHKS